MLKDKVVVIGVCGGIAAYKAAELVRLPIKAGAEVPVVMTRSAQEFITPLTFQTLTGNPVHSELFNLYQEKEIGHIALADRADLTLVVPATANIIGKVAAGLADDLLSTTLMATKSPVLFAPAMNVNMWENPVCQRNLETLRDLGYRILEPATGFLACGWEGKGKLPAPEEIFFACRKMLTPQDLAGETVLVTAGPTRERIDPVRYLSNFSSGKMGYALAEAAVLRGARTILVSGPSCLAVPPGVEYLPVESAREMSDAVQQAATGASIVIKAAAVADYRPAEPASGKLKKSAEQLNLQLVRNPDILAELGSRKGRTLLVGFAAETEELLANAGKKLAEKNLDLIVANDVTQPGAGFDVETNQVRLLYRDGRREDLPLQRKGQLAHLLLDRILALKKGG